MAARQLRHRLGRSGSAERGFERYSVVVGWLTGLAQISPTITTRFASVVVGSPEGLGFAPSHLWLCPKNPVGWLSAPNTPDQRVTLSLHPPIKAPP